MRRILCLALIVLSTWSFTSAVGPSLIIAPRIALAPLPSLHWIARIPRDAGNRAFCVAATLDDTVIRRSCNDLDGDNAEAVFDRYWDNLNEPGTYLLTLSVVDARGHITSVSQTLLLKGGSHDSDGDRGDAPPR